MREELRRVLEKQGYGVVGNHTGVKLCHWTKEDLKNDRHCYKGDFYGIESRGCMQMTPIVDYCNFTCLYCWRSQSFDIDINKQSDWDDPQLVLDGALEQQRRLLSGYKGHPTVEQEKWIESQMPKHVAISLNGEPTFYPHLGEFIRLCHKRGMTTFLVTNGSRPDVLKNLDPLPTQLYISVDAPNEEVFNKLCVPIGGGAWDKLEETIDLLPSLDCRKVSRHTLVKGWNMEEDKGHIDQYAKLDERIDTQFVESKGYVFVGYSRERMTINNMPSHEDVLDFSRKLGAKIGYELQSDKRDSRVALLVKPGVNRFLDLEAWEAKWKTEDHPPLTLANGKVIKDSSWEIARRAAGRDVGNKPGVAKAHACGCGHPHEAHLVDPSVVSGSVDATPTPGPVLNVTFGNKQKANGGGACCGGHL
ncbi:MAG TPA: 4-demethylwyosine synthase TYW1 [Candidatus Thermoplasmatota archaeon]|nr:4-demethylwyosine synthase TYW1 [Candidatus Thermoplasmatota archaeon]